jgi:hypothetical protein
MLAGSPASIGNAKNRRLSASISSAPTSASFMGDLTAVILSLPVPLEEKTISAKTSQVNCYGMASRTEPAGPLLQNQCFLVVTG